METVRDVLSDHAAKQANQTAPYYKTKALYTPKKIHIKKSIQKLKARPPFEAKKCNTLHYSRRPA
jgi:hypothetical protein